MLKVHIFYVLLLTSVTADTCPYKECSCTFPDIICEDLGLKAVPTLTGESSGYSSLILGGNQITQIPAGSLPPNLTSITLSYSPITSIDDAAFDDSATTLTSITLSATRLSRIPDAFRHLLNLKYLNIYDTNILDWNVEAMKTIGQTLLVLGLENDSLSTWPTWIHFYSSLTELTIDVSSISSVPDNALDKLVLSLKGLSISNGSLTSVPKAVSKLVALESLHLHANQISNLTWLPRSNKLSSLSLNNNRISDASHLSNMLRQYGHSLQSLELFSNELTSIPDLSFLSQIGSLDLSYNRISDANSGSMPSGMYEFDLSYNLLPLIPSLWTSLLSVTSMVLHHNVIREIRATDFHPRVIQANLGYNLITELTDTSFPKNFGITMLFLNNNPIVKNSNNAFAGLRSLISLSLKQTKITRVPLALASLVNLYSLDLSNCSDLVCTCLEKNLESRVLSLREVVGQCGQMDIFDFFFILSPTCPS